MTLSHIVTWNKLAEIRESIRPSEAKECYVKCLQLTKILVGDYHPATQELTGLIDNW